MPTTFNSIGTAYVGRSNVHKRRGVCDHCGNIATLSSYDTRLFLVVLYKVPVFPLAAKKILDDCSVCRRHRATGLKKWEREGRAAVDAAIEKAESFPADPDATEAALGTALAFHRPVEFAALAPAAEEQHPRSWPVWRMLTQGHAFFGDQEEAARTAETAEKLAAAEGTAWRERDSRRLRVVALARGGRAEEAATLAAKLRDAPEEDDTFALLVVAETLAARGRATEGLTYLEAIERGNEAFAGEKLFRQRKKKFQRAAETGRELKPELLAAGPAQTEGGRAWLPWAAMLGLPAVALVVFAAMSMSAAGARQVHVVSGLDEATVVEIDGVAVSVPAGGVVPVDLAEGTHAVTLVLPDGRRIDRGSFDVEGSFFGRLFDGDVRVLNADGAALLYDVPVEYGTAVADRPEELLEARLYRTVGEIDYAFEAPPSTLQVDASRKGDVKRELQVDAVPAGEAVIRVLREDGPEAAGAYGLQRMLLEPEDATLGDLVSAFAEPEAVGATLAPLLAERPVRVNVHRVAQDAAAEREGDAAVAARYAGLSDAQPDDADLLYLAARKDLDPTRLGGAAAAGRGARARAPVGEPGAHAPGAAPRQARRRGGAGGGGGGGRRRRAAGLDRLDAAAARGAPRAAPGGLRGRAGPGRGVPGHDAGAAAERERSRGAGRDRGDRELHARLR